MRGYCCKCTDPPDLDRCGPRGIAVLGSLQLCPVRSTIPTASPSIPPVCSDVS